MSTTITYKGGILAMLDNETKTLTTSGKYMEDNVTIADQSMKLLIIDSDDDGGGTIRDIYTKNGVKLQTEKTIAASNTTQTISPDTGYDGFADGAILTVTNGTYLTTMAVYVGDYKNDTITIDKGGLDKYYRRIYGK